MWRLPCGFVDGGPPRQVPRIARATQWRDSGELMAAMLGVPGSDVDGGVKVVLARTATRRARDPSDYRRLLRCGTVGYLIGRSSLDGHRDQASPDPDGVAPAERARVLINEVADYDLAGMSSALGPAAEEVLEGFVAMTARPSAGDEPASQTDELRRAAVVGLGVAVAEAERADQRSANDA
jgi:hypothetical protein